MRLVVGLLCSVLLAGCGAHRMTPVEPRAIGDLKPETVDADGGHVAIRKGFTPKGFTALVLMPFTVAPSEIKDAEDARLAKDMSAYLQAQLLKQLRAASIFSTIIDGSVAAATPSDAKTLQLEGHITKLTEGDQALRYMVGFGAGAAKAQIETRLVDVESKRVELVTADRRAAGMGLFGGDGRQFVTESMDQMAEAYAKLLKHLANGGLPGPR